MWMDGTDGTDGCGTQGVKQKGQSASRWKKRDGNFSI